VAFQGLIHGIGYIIAEKQPTHHPAWVPNTSNINASYFSVVIRKKNSLVLIQNKICASLSYFGILLASFCTLVM
jgi:hypothetical protein